MGNIGFGGKFWRTSGDFRISCYREEESPEVLARIDKVNQEIDLLVNKHNPSREPPRQI